MKIKKKTHKNCYNVAAELLTKWARDSFVIEFYCVNFTRLKLRTHSKKKKNFSDQTVGFNKPFICTIYTPNGKNVRISYDLMYFSMPNNVSHIHSQVHCCKRRNSFYFNIYLNFYFDWMNEWMVCCMNSKVYNDHKLLIFTIDNGAI